MLSFFKCHNHALDRRFGVVDTRAESLEHRDFEPNKTSDGMVAKIEINRKTVRF